MADKKARNSKPIFIAAVIITAVIIYLFLPNDDIDFMSDGVLRVCLDAGHGGEDPGATDQGGVRLEKDDCLRLALAVEEHLKNDFPDVDVVLTRGGDEYPSLEDRCDTANDCKSDLFVSIHRNSSEGNAFGVEIWVESTKPKIDSRLASDILDGLKSVGVSKDRGVKYGTASSPTSDYYVNKHTDMPSCLIEMGFITSDADNELLDKNLDAYAKAISDSIGNMLTK